MKAPTILCSSILIILALTGCNQLSSHDAAVKAIQDTEAQWNQDYASRDVDKIMDHYADDAVLMVPGTPISNGKAAIREGTKPMAADPAMALKFASTRVEVAKSGDLAWTQGTYTLTLTDPQSHQVINDHGSYVTTFRKQPDGSWKVVADIATSEVPPSAPTPAPPTP
jgi:uncharacterized protein (TIGR02246 family)